MRLASPGVSRARVRLSNLFSWTGKALFCLAFLGMYLTPKNPVVTAISAGAWAFMIGAFVASFVVWFLRSPKPGEVAVENGALFVRGGSIPLASVTNALFVPRLVRGFRVPTVEIDLAKGDRVAIQTSTEEEARALVDVLGFGPHGRAVTIDTASPARRMLHILLGIGAYYIGSFAAMIPLFIVLALGHFGEPPAFTGLLLGPAAILAHTWLKTLARAPSLTVGEDGVVLRTGRKRRVIPRADLVGVEQYVPGAPALLKLRNGGSHALAGSSIDIERRAAAARLVWERFFAEPPAPIRAAELGRNGRSVADWRAHVRSLFESGYRTAGTTIDDASAILHSPNATPDERVGAALALRVAGEPPERVRVAASAMVDDRVRVALEELADAGDDAAVDRALARIAT